MWCVPDLTPTFIARMEDVLDSYEKPLDPKEPVVGLDEKPVQLREQERDPKPGRSGKVARYDYEYARCGTANVFCAIEPKAGRHFIEATPNRKGATFAAMLERLAAAYPRARTIHLVVDNLSTHSRKCVTDTLGVKAGTRLWNRFTWHFTPAHGSWLNVAECEISLVSCESLGHDRIPTLERLRERVAAWEADANRHQRKIRWKFTTAKARKKFGYEMPNSLRSGD